MQPTTARILLTLRLVFGALLFGVVIFAAIVFFVLRPTPGDGDSTVFVAALGLVAPAMIVAWALVTRAFRGTLRRQLDGMPEEEATPILHRGFFSASVIGYALGEAYCFFALVVYMVTAAPIALAGAGVGIVALLAQLPTADRFQRFAEEVRGQRPS